MVFQDAKYRPTYVVDLDDMLEQVNYMLDVLEGILPEIEYQNCITVLDHLVNCDEALYGGLNFMKGRRLEQGRENTDD